MNNYNSIFVLGKKCFYRLIDKYENSLYTELKTKHGNIDRFVIVKFEIEKIFLEKIVGYKFKRDFSNKKSNVFSLFSYFNNYIEVENFINLFEENNRHFFEIIPSDNFQKIKFDIDIDKKEVFSIMKEIHEDFSLIDLDMVNYFEIIENIISVLIKLFKKYYLIDLCLEKDVLIYSSHGGDKKSYHIVIDNYSVQSSSESKNIYKLLMKEFEDLSKDYSPTLSDDSDRLIGLVKNINKDITKIPIKYYENFIDNSVYKQNQNFRLLGSSKIGKNKRTKIQLLFWKFKGKIIKYDFGEIIGNIDDFDKVKKSILFKNSLITYVDECRSLPYLLDETETNKNNNFQIKNLDHISSEKVIDLLINYFENLGVSPSCFDLNNISNINNFILIKRLEPSYCEFCERVHENENPFVVVNQDNNVFYNCRRRGEGQPSTYIGKLNNTFLQENLSLYKPEKVNTNSLNISCEISSEIDTHKGCQIRTTNISQNSHDDIIKNKYSNKITLDKYKVDYLYFDE